MRTFTLRILLTFFYFAPPAYSDGLVLQWDVEESGENIATWRLPPSEIERMLHTLGNESEIVSHCSNGFWGGFTGWRVQSKLANKLAYWEASCGSVDMESGAQQCEVVQVSADELNSLGWPVMHSGVGDLDLSAIDYDSELSLGGERLYVSSISKMRPFGVDVTFVGCHCMKTIDYNIESSELEELLESNVVNAICI